MVLKSSAASWILSLLFIFVRGIVKMVTLFMLLAKLSRENSKKLTGTIWQRLNRKCISEEYINCKFTTLWQNSWTMCHLKRLAKPSDKHSRGFTYSNSHLSNHLTFSPTNFRETISLKGTGLTRFPGSSIYKKPNRPPQVLIFMYFPTLLQLCQDSQLFFRWVGCVVCTRESNSVMLLNPLIQFFKHWKRLLYVFLWRQAGQAS